MHRSIKLITKLLSATALSAVLCWPAGASAQSASPGAPADVSQVRGVFVNLGYEVEQPLVWTWTSPPVTTFRVSDPRRDRQLVVLVYASVDAAERAAQRDGGRLVLGFGPGTVRGNIAIVQTNSTDLSRAYRAQNALDDGMDGDRLVDPPRIVTPVDLEFLQALDNSVATL
jgi:hypothetical protein